MTSFDLIDAVLHSNYNIVNCLINKGIDVNYTSRSGEMPLHLSVEKGLTDIALLLINSGSNINVKNDFEKTPLFLAAEFNNASVVKSLLSRQNLNVNLYCYGKTPLHVACEKGHEDVVKEFISNYRTMFWIDVRFQGNLPIHITVSNGYSNVTRLLLDKMTSVNSVDKEGHTPFWIALMKKNVGIIKLLLDNYRVNSTFRLEGVSPLLYAVREHMEEVVRLLVMKGANVQAKDPDKRTVLHHCALEGISNLIQLFIDKGTDLFAVDTKGYTAFHYAVTRWNIDVIKVFLSNGIDINGRLMSRDGYTPFQLAFKRGNLDVAKLLIENGADVNAIDPHAHFAMSRGGTLLHWACRDYRESDARFNMKFLVENGANVNAEENDGRTPLCLLVKHHGSVDAIRYLIDNGAELNTDKGGSPLYWAFYMRYYDIAQFLIENGSDVNGRIGNFDGWEILRTPLHVANNLSIVKLLIDKGANTNSLDKEGNTPLHKVRSLPIAECLVDNGADISIANFHGDTPLHSADNVHIAEYLIEKGANVNILNYRGYTPLHLANNVHIAQLLIEHGANVRSINKEGRTVLHSVAEADQDTPNHADLIDYFIINYNIDANTLDFQGNSALKISSIKWNHEVARRLLNNGATLRLFNVESNGCNFYYLQHLNELLDTLKSDKPLKRSMNAIRMTFPLNYREDDTKSTMLHVAVKYGRKDFVDHLVNRKYHNNAFVKHTNRINLNSCDIDGQTPLHIAAIKNDNSLVKSLLSGGAIYNCRNSVGKLPLHLTENTAVQLVFKLVETAFDAVENGHLDMLTECITSEKSIINALNENGFSLLHIACINCNLDIINRLLHNGADFTLVNNEKETVLHLAVSFMNQNIVYTLLRHFIKSYHLFINNNYKINNTHQVNSKLSIFDDFINLKTVHGKTALHIASEKGSLDTVKLLIRCGAMFNSKDKSGKTPFDYSRDKIISDILTSIDELFYYAKMGNATIVEKLKINEVKSVVSYITRNKYGNTLVEYIKVNGHEKLADEIKTLLHIPMEMFEVSNSHSNECENNSDSDDMGFGLFD